ncbi:MAG TPA: RNA polymerase sigma factor [Croceibacterium sp.]|nr:RNA polymerase sigma factor [Croceibacterium sp.]
MNTQPAPLLATDDIELARRCAAGEEAAVRLVTTANNQRLFRAAWSILREQSEAEDAVQTAYLKAFASIEQYEGRSALSTWLTRIVIHEALRRSRTASRRRSRLEAEGVTMLNDHRKIDAPDEALAREQLRKIMETAIAALPEAFRTVFVLREVEGLSIESTSQALDIPIATVKTRLFRARRKLKDALAPELRSALVGTFPFAGPDCERMTLRVIDSLKLSATQVCD